MAATAKSKKTRQDFASAINDTVNTTQETTSKSKRPSGRPSTGKTIRITLAIPEDLLHGIDTASLLHKGNRTAYINSLIKKDLDTNLLKYEEFNKMLNNI